MHHQPLLAQDDGQRPAPVQLYQIYFVSDAHYDKQATVTTMSVPRHAQADNKPVTSSSVTCCHQLQVSCVERVALPEHKARAAPLLLRDGGAEQVLHLSLLALQQAQQQQKWMSYVCRVHT
jgi:hypothetical protein